MRIAVAARPAVAGTLQQLIAGAPDHELAWAAVTGAAAVEMCARAAPDLLLLEAELPDMPGGEATRRIMAAAPCAILVLSRDGAGDTALVFDAISAGAMDAGYLPTPGGGRASPGVAALLARIGTMQRLIDAAAHADAQPPRPNVRDPATGVPERLVILGASAGGPAALAAVLAGLPADLPAAVVIIQHIDQRFAAGMALWLAERSELPVRVARTRDEPIHGQVLLAGTADHLVFTGRSSLGYTAEPKEAVYRPSVDVFFESVARFWQGTVVAALLTGMGRDGATGLRMLRDAGALTIAQDRATSAVYGMPKAAAQLDAAAAILPLDRIAARIAAACKSGSAAADPPTTLTRAKQ